MLNLVEKQLSKYKVKTELFSGAVPVILRNKIVDEFNNNAGGVKVSIIILFLMVISYILYVNILFYLKYHKLSNIFSQINFEYYFTHLLIFFTDFTLIFNGWWSRFELGSS